MNLKKTTCLLIVGFFAFGASSLLARSPQARHDPAKGSSALQDSLSKLKSRNVTERRQGVEELGRLRQPRSAPALVVALSDEDPSVRAGAARALGLMRSPDGLNEIIFLLENDPEPTVRQSAAVSLGFISRLKAADPLVAALSDKHVGTRYASAQALVSLKAPAAVPAFRKAVGGSDAKFRRIAAHGLGELGDRAAVPDLQPLLKDKNPAVQLAAVEALGKLGDASSKNTLKKYLRKKKKPELRVTAAHALARMGLRDGRTAAMEVLRDRSLEPRLRVIAAKALGQIGGKSVAKDLSQVLEDEPEGFVKSAVTSVRDRLRNQNP